MTRGVTICGAGTQARTHLRAFRNLFPLQRVFVFTRNQDHGREFAAELSAELGLSVELTADLNIACQSDIVLTRTTSCQAFSDSSMVSPGTFVGAIGADSPQKQELAPELVAQSKVVADLLAQCLKVGELHHALDAGLTSADKVHSELGEIIVGRKTLQDVAAAARVYEKAVAAERGTVFDFAGTA